ncbi:hypothetical protein Metbo_0213 [Methanobacterium lacus]|jgi:hypothetical protein|uniref:Uncharacterized protein n=1 Tax=Methanobacterium lacus (strain AL-21) TaxID=877455 RepID=F0T7X8_METLA|nr:hypothetical protein [Methanobacterium lacus]ADZ08465.1 hypothetical protein Metbo_0213 [Methanobacterium lacus]
MEIKATVGVCTKLKNNNEDQLVVVPKDGEMFEKNQVVLVISAAEFENLSSELQSMINMVKGAQAVDEI